MTAQYLDKEKVRKALGSIREHLNREYGPGFDKAVCDMGMQIERGEFDAKNEPELFICNGAQWAISQGSDVCGPCPRCKPHKPREDCIKHGCIMNNEWCKCIPYKEPTVPQPSAVPTSGTGTAPEYGRTLEQKVKDLEIVTDDTLSKILFPKPYLHKDLKIVTDDTRLRTYPGMAKDIGDLTLRVDNLETAFKSLKEEVNGISITAENGTIYSLKVKREL